MKSLFYLILFFCFYKVQKLLLLKCIKKGLYSVLSISFSKVLALERDISCSAESPPAKIAIFFSLISFKTNLKHFY